MPSLFKPRLTNPPSGDPGLFVPFSFDRRALLFDIGDTDTLSSKDLLKISDIFITHTHMDHFCGFDRLLRLVLGREKELRLYGPEGFLANMDGRLAGYSWNLLKNYSSELILNATEIQKNQRIDRRYSSRNRFRRPGEDRIAPLTGPVLVDEDAFSVTAAVLDHGIDCLGFSLKEKFRINIRKDALERLGIRPGPWLREFKQALYGEPDAAAQLIVPAVYSAGGEKRFVIRELEKDLAIITPGRKITYVSDAAYTKANIEKILQLAENSDHLFIEAAFLEADADHARRKYHLTARQAGEIAALTGAKRFSLFHFSPRYSDAEQQFQDEATAAYATAELKKARTM